MRYRNISFGIQTVLGIRKLGFFIPFKFAAEVPEVPPAYEPLETAFAARRAAFQSVLDDIRDEADALASALRGPLSGQWGSGYFSRLDTAACWAIARRHAPRRIIEVGSGTSTHVLHAATRATVRPAEILCIDPAPRSDISALGVSCEGSVLADRHLEKFAGLEPGDIAFFDSSHVLFQGTDVDIIFNRILPILAPGVIVHFHDIFLPDPYPEAWSHRAYTEQLALSGWLIGGASEPLFSSHFAATRMAAAARDALSELDVPEPGGGSLWLRR